MGIQNTDHMRFQSGESSCAFNSPWPSRSAVTSSSPGELLSVSFNCESYDFELNELF